YYTYKFILLGNPAGTAIKSCDAVSTSEVHNGCPLIGCPGIAFYSNVFELRVIAAIRSFGNKARYCSQALPSADGLEVLVKNLFGSRHVRRLPCNFGFI